MADEPQTDQAAAVMPLEDAKLWKARLAASREFIKPVLAVGKKNVLRQKQKFFESTPSVDSIAAPDDFFLSQQKIAKIFYKVPEVQLSGKRPEFEGAAPLAQAVLNEYLDAEHINVKATIDEMLTDLITAVGFGACKIGYNATIVDVPVTDPTTGAPVRDPLTGQPQTQKSLIHEAYECSRIPPGRMLFAPEFIRSDFDTGPYIGFTFIEDVLPGTEHAQTSQITEQDDLLSKPPAEAANTSRTYLIVDAMWFKGSLFNKDVQNPEEIWEFEWVRGAESPRVYRKCPYQKFPGFPVKVLTTRYISDTALPPSDTTITRNIIDAKSLGLSLELIHRMRSLPQNAVDTSRLDGDVLQKLEANVMDAMIGFGMPVTDDLIRPIVKGQLPQEHYALQEQLDRMVAASWSMGASQTGAKERGTHTATELNIVESNMDTRLGYEEDKAAVFFLTKMVRPIAALIQQYAPADGGYVRVLGPDGAMKLQQWTPALIQGDFAFKIKINSQLRPDSQADLKKTTDWVNYSAKSEYVNQMRNWQLAAEAFGFDPAQLIIQPQPRGPVAEPAPIAVQDLILVLASPEPMRTILVQTLIAWKVPFPPETASLLAAMPAPPVAPNTLTAGTADEAPVLTKHVDSGELPGGGALVASGVVPANAATPNKVM